MVSIKEFKFPYKSRTSKHIHAILSDTHIGNKGAHKDLIKRTIGWIDEYADTWSGGGDYIDAITHGDERRFDWETLDRHLATPKEQVAWMADALKPIANKCLGLLRGNHEYEVERRQGYDAVDTLAEKLGTEAWGYSAFMRFRFNRGQHRTKFDIFMHHGKSAARTKGGKINKLRSLDRIFEADAYCMSHVHDVEADIRPFLTIDNQRNIVEKRKLYVLTGGFLRGYIEDVSTYVERGMYAPTTLGGVFLEFTPEKNIYPSLRAQEIPVMPKEASP